jgi:hypothetical protein
MQFSYVFEKKLSSVSDFFLLKLDPVSQTELSGFVILASLFLLSDSQQFCGLFL